MKFKVGDKVKPIENHPYLGIKKSNVGMITAILPRDYIHVKFSKRTVIFDLKELRRK